MRILFTGGSSFTGYWIIRALAASGHEVTATFTRESLNAYEGMRRRRIDLLPQTVERCWVAPFGSDKMVALVARGGWDLLCHHGAMVGNGFREASFDCESAVRSNTHGMGRVLSELKRGGCRRFLLTGSYFEAGEGGDPDNEALSSYGLSKTLTWQAALHHCLESGMSLGKYVIPNPFGLLEEGRLPGKLIRDWREGKTAVLQSPHDVRDYIPVDLLAADYCRAAETFYSSEREVLRFCPSFWVESNLDFARRMARELELRLGVACPVESPGDSTLGVTSVRRNLQPVDPSLGGWSEANFWNEFAQW